MKKQIFYLTTVLIAAAFCFTGCSTSTPAEQESEEQTSGILKGELATPQTLPEAILTVPSYLQGAETDGFIVVEENEASVTYQLNEKQQTETIDRVITQIQSSIHQVLTDKEYYPHITGISVNEDCTEFNVTFLSTDINIYETTLRMSLYIAGEKYQLYQGKPENEFHTVVNYIDDATGDIISTGSSVDLH